MNWNYFNNIFTNYNIRRLINNNNIYNRILLWSTIISLFPLMFRDNYIIFTITEILVSIVFIIDYTLKWIISKNPIKYPFTIGSIVDLMAILPIINYFNNNLKIFRIWKLLRLLRIIKFLEYYKPVKIIIKVFRKKKQLLLTVIGFALFYIYITALVMFNIEEPVTKSGEVFFENFLDAIYWATCTLTTVGYGDVYPISNLGRVISMISSLVGIAIIALPSGILTAGYIEEINK